MKKKPLARIWVDPDVKKRIKMGAAAAGCTLSDFVKKKVSDDKAEDILDTALSGKRSKKRGGFDFPF